MQSLTIFMLVSFLMVSLHALTFDTLHLLFDVPASHHGDLSNFKAGVLSSVVMEKEHQSMKQKWFLYLYRSPQVSLFTTQNLFIKHAYLWKLPQNII